MDNSKVRIVTHSSKFHVDDVFAVATLLLVLQHDRGVEVIRSRDPKVIATGDYVVDVGGVYDPKLHRFDHHQEGGAGVGENSIPYSSFGLVWKHFSLELCGSQQVADRVNRVLVQPIDAHDNGIKIVKETIGELYPYGLNELLYAMRPTWKEDSDLDAVFMRAVTYAMHILVRQIIVEKDEIEGIALVEEAYKNAEDKRIIVLDERWPWKEILSKHAEPLFVVYPKRVDGTWSVKCVPEGLGLQEFNSRKDFPIDWAGKTGVDLEKITGVEGSLFCHNRLFLATATSKESALKLAQIAVDA